MNFDNNDVYVIGHRNPDLDSICSAIAYSRLKNIIDKKRTYIPARCGHLNNQSTNYLKTFSIQKPSYFIDSYIHVRDVYTSVDMRLDINDPLHKLVSIFEDDKYKYSVIPIFKDNKFYNLLTKESIASYFLKVSNAKKREEITFNPMLWSDVVGGKFLKYNDNLTKFKASLMIGCMQGSEVAKRIRLLKSEGRKIVFITGNRIDTINTAIKEKADAVIITGFNKDCEEKIEINGYKGFVFASDVDTAQTIRLLRLQQSISHIRCENFPSVKEDSLFEEEKMILLSKGLKALVVRDNNGEYLGFLTRRNFLCKPKRSFILVDHNEKEQCIEGIDEADIKEIVDHHRFNSEKTSSPIFINSEPVGSTCTIVWELYKRRHVKIDAYTAIILLGGIVSDTVFMKSPTATSIDKKAYQDLLRISGLSEQELSDVIYSNYEKFDDLDCDKTVSSDFKMYTENGVKFGVGQVEVVGMPDARNNQKINQLLNSLEKIKDFQFLSFAMLMISDAQTASSLLLSTKARITDNLQYAKISENVFDMPGVLSRKKQLLPELIRALSE